MADRQRWLWAVFRLAHRSRWTFFGWFATLGVIASAVMSWFFYLAEHPRGPADFFIPFAITAAFMILFWLGWR